MIDQSYQIRTCQNASESVKTHQNVSKRIRMHQNVSECIRTLFWHILDSFEPLKPYFNPLLKHFNPLWPNFVQFLSILLILWWHVKTLEISHYLREQKHPSEHDKLFQMASKYVKMHQNASGLVRMRQNASEQVRSLFWPILESFKPIQTIFSTVVTQ